MARRDTYVIEFRTTGTARVKRDIASIGKSANSSRRALAFLRSFLVIFASVAIFSGIFRLADAFTTLTNRIGVLSKDANTVTALRGELFKLANEVRLPIENLTETFVRTSRSTLRLGLNFKQLIAITKTLAIATQLSGATSQEASAGLQQFGQGLAAGALQGEELRSVVEQLPRVADTIAKEFIPELIEAGLAVEGQIEGLGGLLRPLNEWRKGILKTTRVVKAFRDAGEELAEQFSRIRPTIEQAFVVFRNRVIEFAGNLNQATGVANSLAEGIIALSFHVDKLILGFTALIGIFVLNLIIGQVIALGARFAALVVFVLKLGSAFGKALAALAKLAGLVGLFVSGGLAILGVVAAWIRWGDEIQQTIFDMGGLGNITKVTIAIILGLVETMVEEWELLLRGIPAFFGRAFINIIGGTLRFLNLLSKIFIEGILGIVRAGANILSGFGDAIVLALQGRFTEAGEALAGGLAAPGAVLDDVVTKAGEGIAAIAEFFADSGANADEFGKRLETNIAIKLTEINELIRAFQTPGIDVEELLKRPEGSTDPIEVGKLTKAQQKLVDSFNDLIASIDPYTDRVLTLKEAMETYNAGVELAGGSSFSLAEVLKRVDREFLGVGNVATDVAAKMGNLQSAYELGRISAIELAIAQKELNEELLGAAADLEKAVSPIAAFYSELEDAQNAVALAVERGALSQDKANEILRRTERELLGVGNATETYEEKMVLLNAALIRGTISQEEFRNAARETRIEVLEDQRTMAAGIERAMLKIEETYGNTAANVESAFTTVFQNLEDRLAEFIETGEFSITDFLETIRQEIARAFIREAIGELATIFNDVVGAVLPGTGAGEDPEAAASQVLVAAKTAENAAVQAATVAKNAEVIAAQAANAAQQAQILAVQAITGEFTFMQQPLLTVNTLLTTAGTTVLPPFNAACLAATACLQNLTLACEAAAASGGGEEGGGGGGLGGLIGTGIGLAAAAFGGGAGGSGSVNDGGSLGGQGTGNFDLANQGSFASGGSFTVGPGNSSNLGGTDNRLVQFRAQDGEGVEITPRGGGQRSNNQRPITVNFNGITDFDKFKRNSTQISSRLAGSINRASTRTN